MVDATTPDARQRLSAAETTAAKGGGSGGGGGSSSGHARPGPAGGSRAPPAGSKKSTKDMTKAERRALQEQQREAKAKEKAAKEGSAPSKKGSASAGPSGANAPGRGQAGSTQTAGASTSSSTTNNSNNARQQARHAPSSLDPNASTSSSAVSSPLSLFLHLDPPRSAKSLNAKIQKDQIHKSITRLALQYADFKIVGANARCLAMLEAFKEVISSYIVPPGRSLTRHLPAYLSPQITHLVRARPMAVSMGNAIRYLKWEIAQVPPDMQDDDAKELLCERIDHFIRDRIVLAGKVIEENAIQKIREGDVILTYARSSLVEGVLLAAKSQGKSFSVVVVDSRPMHEGKHLLKRLLAHDIPSSYVLLPSIGSVLSTVSLTLLGTHALLSNGAMFSRAGTAMVAMMSKGAGIPVICCCETYKFSDRIMLDSIVGNELASTASILPPNLAGTESSNLGVLNFLYDVSRPEDVTAVVTETATIPVLSVPFVLREHKPINLGG